MKRSGPYRVKITLGDAILEVEGGEKGVVKIVEAVSEVFAGSRRSSPPRPAGLVQPVAASPPSKSSQDIRVFFQEKAPSSDVEAAAVAAYYYQYVAPDPERRDHIDSALLQTAFRLARRPLPARVIYTLQNARNAGYLDSIGDGRFKLNPVGYNLVEHALGRPSEEGSKGKARKKLKLRRRRKAKVSH